MLTMQVGILLACFLSLKKNVHCHLLALIAFDKDGDFVPGVPTYATKNNRVFYAFRQITSKAKLG